MYLNSFIQSVDFFYNECVWLLFIYEDKSLELKKPPIGGTS